MISEFSEPDGLELLAGFEVSDNEFFSTSILVLGIAIAVSVVGSLVAVTRYLDA